VSLKLITWINQSIFSNKNKNSDNNNNKYHIILIYLSPLKNKLDNLQMSDDLKEFLHKSTIGLEIEDIDEDENVDEMR